YIMEVGRDPGPGNPSLFGTTSVFLEKMGLASLDELPPIADFVPGPEVVEQLEQGLRAEVAEDVVAEIGGGAGSLAESEPTEPVAEPEAAAEPWVEGVPADGAEPVPEAEPWVDADVPADVVEPEAERWVDADVPADVR